MVGFGDALRGYAFPVHRRDGFRCRYCGLDGTKSFSNWLALSWDHLLPKGHPSRDSLDFIVTACMFCNTADNRYFDRATERSLSFDKLAADELIAQRLPYVEKTRQSYREFWAENVMKAWGDPELAALGQIVVTFAGLEWYAERMLAGFVGDDLIGTVLVTGETMTWRLEKLSVIATEVLATSEVSQALLAWIKATRALNDRRNQMMHSLFVLAEGEESVTRMKASTRGGKWRGHKEPMSLGDLAGFADLLGEGLIAAEQLMRELAASPEWHRPAS